MKVVSIDDLHRIAKRRLSKPFYNYVADGAYRKLTLARNRADLDAFHWSTWIAAVIPSLVLSVLCALAWRSWVFETGRSGGEHLPLGQGGRAAQLVGLAVDEVAFG